MRVEQANLFNNAAYRLRSNEVVANDLHDRRIIHIHDKEYDGVTYNCLGVSFNSCNYSEDCIENFEYNLDKLFEEIVFLTNEQSGGIGYINIDRDLKDLFRDIPIKYAIGSIRRFFNKLNLPLRNGYERAYVTFNLGLDTSIGGRKVSEVFLKALELGKPGSGEPFTFPNIVFKLKKGINTERETENYDLFQQALEVTGRRMNPTYFNCDSRYLNNIDENKLGIMGCRTLLTNNINGENGAIGRGNLASISINLPKIAKLSSDEQEFFENLENVCNSCRDILINKYRALSNLDTHNFSYIIDNKLYLGTEEETPEMKKVFSNGTLSIGFIGLFDSIGYLKDKEITYEFIRDNVETGEKILKFMRDLTDQWSRKSGLNFSLLASSGEGISGRFASDDNKEYYTNFFHVPVYTEVNPFEKLEIESRFLKYCNGGEISYIEFSTPVLANNEAIADLLYYGIENNHIYMGINFPLDYCMECSSTGVFKGKKCDRCGSENIRQLRRVSGYLSLKENLKSGKKAEERDRVSHLR